MKLTGICKTRRHGTASSTSKKTSKKDQTRIWTHQTMMRTKARLLGKKLRFHTPGHLHCTSTARSYSSCVRMGTKCSTGRSWGLNCSANMNSRMDLSKGILSMRIKEKWLLKRFPVSLQPVRTIWQTRVHGRSKTKLSKIKLQVVLIKIRRLWIVISVNI